MEKIIYEINVFNVETNETETEPVIFWKLEAAIKYAEEIVNGFPDYPAGGSVRVLKEYADEDGYFRTIGYVFNKQIKAHE